MVRDNRLVVGVDPGVSGAFAVLSLDGRFRFVQDFPKIRWGDSRFEVDGAAFQDVLDGIYRNTEVVGIEAVNAGAVQSRLSAFSFGAAYATVRQLCRASRFTVWMVRPPVWKKALGLLGSDKSGSVVKAVSIYPTCAYFVRKNHNRADSILIAEYTRMEYLKALRPRPTVRG